MVGRYTHAHQFKRARRELKFLRTLLGRIMRAMARSRIASARCSISRCMCAIERVCEDWVCDPYMRTGSSLGTAEFLSLAD